jgi:hypothetical protein
MSTRIPPVKAADNGNPARIRRPDTKNRTCFSAARNQMRAHGFIKAVVATLVEQVEVLVGEQRKWTRGSGGRDFKHPKLLVYRRRAHGDSRPWRDQTLESESLRHTKRHQRNLRIITSVTFPTGV